MGGKKHGSLNGPLDGSDDEDAVKPTEQTSRDKYKAMGNKKPKNKTKKGQASTWADEM